MSYSEKLRDPRWQKKRLEILNRENFTCELCSDQDTELHVHHKGYSKGAEPWEYEDSNFQCLCKHCHSLIEHLKPYQTVAYACMKTYEDGYVNVVAVAAKEEAPPHIAVLRIYDAGEVEYVVSIRKSSLMGIQNLLSNTEKLIYAKPDAAAVDQL